LAAVFFLRAGWPLWAACGFIATHQATGFGAAFSLTPIAFSCRNRSKGDTMATPALTASDEAAALATLLGGRAIVFVGLMGAGKTAIGRRVAAAIGLNFSDSDQEIEKASRMSVADLFETYGEAEFRSLEQRVIARLLQESPNVLATGGGAFMNADTRAAISEHGVSIWLKADIDTLMARVAKKQTRPLLKTGDPRAVMENLMTIRHPVYAQADVTVNTRDDRREVIAEEVIAAIVAHLGGRQA
jgi:shikimate kinase